MDQLCDTEGVLFFMNKSHSKMWNLDEIAWISSNLTNVKTFREFDFNLDPTRLKNLISAVALK